MRFRHFLAIILFAAVAFGTAGCKGEYYFNFAEEQDVSNKDGYWTVRENANLCYFLPEGLRIEDVNLACPKKFSGDFTMTVVFDLMVDSANRYNFGINLSDGDFYFDSVSDMHMDFYAIGSDKELFQLFEHDSSEINVTHEDGLDRDLLFEKLNRQGENTWVLTKLGDIFTVSVNGFEFAEFDYGTYDGKWFVPNIYAYNTDPVNAEHGFTLRSVLVDYNGSMVDR